MTATPSKSPEMLRILAANLLASSDRTVAEVLSTLSPADADTVRALMDLFRSA